jgi:hypothetical protein
MKNTQIKSKRASESISNYDGYYCLSTYFVEMNGKFDEITINTNDFICKSHFVKWSDNEFNLIVKNITTKFKRFTTKDKKFWEDLVESN